MEWFILLALVPAIVAPVVVLYGFAGCEFKAQDGVLSPPADPTNVRVLSKDLDRITIAWDYLDSPPLPVTFEVEITDLNTDPPDQTSEPGIPQATPEFPHTGLQEGKVFEYRVRAVQEFETKESNWVPDPPLRAATLSFQLAFEEPGLINGGNDGGNGGACTVQRIEANPARLLRSGSLVRLTLRGPSTGGLTLDRITISRAAVPGDDPNNPAPDPYDSGPDRTDVAASAVVVPTNDSIVLPPVAYPLNKDVPLLIAFDISNALGQGTFRFVGNVPGNVATMYSNANTTPVHQAGTNNRDAGYNPLARVHIVEKIEVAAETPLP